MGFLNPNNAFAGQNDPTGYTNMTGQAAAPGTLAYEGVTPGSGQNSLEQYLRSLQNYGGQQSQNFINTGQGLLSSGTNAVQAPMSYYSSLLSGNPASMAQAIQPEVSAIKGQYGNLRNQADQFAPMGGGRSSLMANMPYQMQGQIGNMLAQVRPMAAQQLGTLGMGQQQMGLGASNLGANMLSQMLDALYAGRGQDVGETGQNKTLAANMSRDLTTGLLGATSDIRIKENIQFLGDIDGLGVYAYNFIGSAVPQIGMMAQEVFTRFPEDVIVGGKDPFSEPWMIRYGSLIPKLRVI